MKMNGMLLLVLEEFGKHLIQELQDPIADDQPFYSTGCITIDPHNSSKIWLGTGENVGGRHVGIGHGVYLSENGGENGNIWV